MDDTNKYIFHKHDIIELPKEEQDQILTEIGENDESKISCLTELTQKLQAQSKFQPCLERDFLLMFLRFSKFNISKAFIRIQKFYSMQERCPDYYGLCSERALPKSDLIVDLVSPFRMKDNSLVFIFKFFIKDFSNISIKEKYYLDSLALDKVSRNPVTQMCGVTFIIDVCDVSLSNVLHYSPSYLKFHMDNLQGAHPIRIKGIHLVNSPSLFKIVFDIGYPFLSKKIQQRTHVHPKKDNWKSLHSYIPPEILPIEYGGFLENSSMINVLEDVYEMENDFRKHSPFQHGNKAKS